MSPKDELTPKQSNLIDPGQSYSSVSYKDHRLGGDAIIGVRGYFSFSWDPLSSQHVLQLAATVHPGSAPTGHSEDSLFLLSILSPFFRASI